MDKKQNYLIYHQHIRAKDKKMQEVHSKFGMNETYIASVNLLLSGEEISKLLISLMPFTCKAREIFSLDSEIVDARSIRNEFNSASTSFGERSLDHYKSFRCLQE